MQLSERDFQAIKDTLEITKECLEKGLYRVVSANFRAIADYIDRKLAE